MSSQKEHTNDLINETSPYLLQHAHNPVNWHAWNEESLKEAKKLDKPILISIGYSSCHWCHVMEHESFEDDEVAQVMNDYFYCIKVDREERPDVDNIYMTAANIITGGGGWPLNCFALPDKRPFHAGTYYPKQGWLGLLKQVHDQFTNNRPALEAYATKLTKGIELQETAISDQSPQKLTHIPLQQAFANWPAQWDTQYGGTNKAPKFPMPSSLNLVQRSLFHYPNENHEAYLDVSLTQMAYGGIYDQIGGGFSRYSTDIFWKVPHFEKMLYDNAQLLTTYSLAYSRSKKPLYEHVISQTVSWLEREMLDKSGLFYSALDADSEGEEGKFYVWSSEELKLLLKEDYELAKDYYNVDGKGSWEHGNSILLRDKSDADIANKLSITVSELSTKVESINSRLLSARDQRIRPGLDDKCLTSWNGLMITGLVDAFKATGNTTYLKLAQNCGDGLLRHVWKGDALKHSYKDGKATIDGMLEDYVFTATGLLDLFSITQNEDYYTAANEMAVGLKKRFYDREKGVFYFNTSEDLIVNTVELYDNVIPSTNSASVQLFHHLGLLQGNTEYLSLAEDLTSKVQDNIANYPSSYSNWGLSLFDQTLPFYEVIVTGKNAAKMALALQNKFLPNILVFASTSSSELPMFKGRFKADADQIYICKKGTCMRPVGTIEEAMTQLKK